MLTRFVELGKRRTLVLGAPVRKYLEQGEAIVDRPMPFMKVSGLADQVAELCAFKAAPRPIDFGDGTGPCLPGKNGRKGLAERSIETGVVRISRAAATSPVARSSAPKEILTAECAMFSIPARDVLQLRFQ